MNMLWPYYTFKNGKLYDEDGDVAFKKHTFATANDAQNWLYDSDIRGDVLPDEEAREVG